LFAATYAFGKMCEVLNVKRFDNTSGREQHLYYLLYQIDSDLTKMLKAYCLLRWAELLNLKKV